MWRCAFFSRLCCLCAENPKFILRYHPTSFTITAHLIKHPRLKKVPGNLVWELLKSANLSIHGPNTSDTHNNPPIAMLVADTEGWSQYFFIQNLNMASSFTQCQMPSGHSSQVSFFLLVAPAGTLRYTLTHSVTQLCLTVCDPVDCSLPGFSWDYSGRNTEVGCHFLFQEILQTQGLNPFLLSLLHWQADSFITEPPGKLWENSSVIMYGTDPPPWEST